MKERPISQIEKYHAILNFVNYQAQEAIIDPNLPESYKDEILDAVVVTIQKVAERKADYFAKHGDGRRTRQPKLI